MDQMAHILIITKTYDHFLLEKKKLTHKRKNKSFQVSPFHSRTFEV